MSWQWQPGSPGWSWGTSYHQPALKVKGRLISRLLENGEQITLRATLEERDALVATDPALFVITEHHRPYEWVVVRLGSAQPPVLEELLIESWRKVAPARSRKGWDSARASGAADLAAESFASD